METATTEPAGMEPLRVEETRRRVARMVVEESGQRKMASSMLDTVADKAREGWTKIKKMLEGKRISGDSGKLVVEEGGGRESLDKNSEWEEEVMGGTVEVEVEEESELQGDEESMDGWKKCGFHRMARNQFVWVS
jgi:hypothetical protein